MPMTTVNPTNPLPNDEKPLIPAWSCGDRSLDLSRPRVMGVLNVTPDSFSDGGTHNAPDAAVRAAHQMLADGADLIDVGGESTRPGFTPVEPAEELRRLEPVVKELVAAGVLVSIDTRHAEVARACVSWGAQIINDVTGFSDPAMVDVAAESSCGCVVMHTGPVTGAAAAAAAGKGAGADAGKDDLSQLMNHASAGDRSWEEAGGLTLSEPGRLDADAETARASRPIVPEAAPVVGRVRDYLLGQAHILEGRGVDPSRICLDPGVGFGKSPEDNVVLLRGTAELAHLGYPLMCAVSRKRFVGTVSGVAEAAGRDAATAGLSLAASQAGARVLRVHDVAVTTQALDGFWIASENAETMYAVTLEIPDRAALMQAAEAIDAMALARVCAVGMPVASATGSSADMVAELRVCSELDRVPFARELSSALAATGASVKAVRP